MAIRVLLAALCFFAIRSFAVIEVGETVPHVCFQTDSKGKFCLADAPNTVRVLIYNAGWCPACNEELAELVPRVSEFQNKPVTFISVSAQGWRHGSTPDANFLTQWKKKYHIPFIVAASPNDFGKRFIEPPVYIPNVAIVDPSGNLAFSGVNPGTDAIFAQIRKLLP